MAPRILIYCPLAPTEPRIQERTWQSLMDLYWYEPVDIVYGRQDMRKYPGSKAGNLNLLEKYQQARRLALEGGYDALLTVEADIIIPRIALERMKRIDADVVYGLYVSRHGHPHHWLAFTEIHHDFKGVKLSDHPEQCREAWGCVVETKGIGMGCTLIRRHVLEAIEFRCPDTQVANDWFFALDCLDRGYKQAHDCGVVCGHITSDIPARILWPDIDAPDLCREEVL